MAVCTRVVATTVGKAVDVSDCLLCKIDTGTDDTYSVCHLVDNRVVSGHYSSVKVWSVNENTVLHTIPTATSGHIMSVCQAVSDEHLFAVSVSASVMCYDDRNLAVPLAVYTYNEDEINQISFHPRGYLSACDDAGEVKIIDTENRKLFKTLSGPHSNICSSAVFVSKKPTELVSGGMDCKLVKWDFTRSRPITEITINNDSEQSLSMFINPPMVYSLDTWATNSCIVCGLGNGDLNVYRMKGKDIEFHCSSSLHSAMVSCVRCIEKAVGDTTQFFIVSSSNDGSIIVSKMVENEVYSKKSKRCPIIDVVIKPIAKIQHGSKINWLSVNSLGTQVCVADQTSYMTTYNLFL